MHAFFACLRRFTVIKRTMVDHAETAMKG